MSNLSTHARMIPGGIAIAFQTRRVELLQMELRRLRALPSLATEEGPLVLNALEMALGDLWQIQEALVALNGVNQDLINALHGAQRLADLQHSIGHAAHTGAELPDTAAEIREHFKRREGEEGEGE